MFSDEAWRSLPSETSKIKLENRFFLSPFFTVPEEQTAQKLDGFDNFNSLCIFAFKPRVYVLSVTPCLGHISSNTHLCSCPLA